MRILPQFSAHAVANVFGSVLGLPAGAGQVAYLDSQFWPAAGPTP